MYKHILIPTDGSELSKMALSYRVRVGSAYGLQFVRQNPQGSSSRQSDLRSDAYRRVRLRHTGNLSRGSLDPGFGPGRRSVVAIRTVTRAPQAGQNQWCGF
jgi:hypothetical protein